MPSQLVAFRLQTRIFVAQSLNDLNGPEHFGFERAELRYENIVTLDHGRVYQSHLLNAKTLKIFFSYRNESVESRRIADGQFRKDLAIDPHTGFIETMDQLVIGEPL